MNKVPRDFHSFLRKISERGDTVALIDAKNNAHITYAGLLEKVTDTALRLDIKRGERIIVYDINQIDWVVVFFAIQLKGGIVVPIDDRVSEDFIKKTIISVEPKFVISDTKNAALFNSITTYCLKEIQSSSVIVEPLIEVDPNMPCEIIFTSGTWSDPKGVVLSQRNILANVEQVLSVYPQKRPEVVLGILPLSHAYQQTIGLFTPLALGSKIVFLQIINSIELLNAIKTYKITLIPLVPRVMELIYSSIMRKIRSHRNRKLFAGFIKLCRFLPRFVRRSLFYFIHRSIGTTLRTFVSGGSPLRKDIDDFFQGLGYEVMVGYGLSECAPIVCAHFGQHREIGEVGKALPGVEIILKDGGEICVKGENVFLGYWPNHSSVYMFETGDLGLVKTNQSLVLKGRNKNLMIFDNGEKCFCEDLESIINEIDGVELSCVIGKTRNGSLVAECLVGIKKLYTLQEKEILNHVKTKVPMGIVLSRAVIIESGHFPVTHTLKVHRAKVSSLLN